MEPSHLGGDSKGVSESDSDLPRFGLSCGGKSLRPALCRLMMVSITRRA